ncbi:MAG: type II toxin-antitoxin system Phd/YefM family antitoxin [Bacillota bacterium]
MSVSFDKEQIVSVTDLQRNLGRVIDKARSKDVIVMRNNYPSLVLLSFERYEELSDLAESIEIYNLVQQRKENSAPSIEMAEVIKQLDLTEEELDLIERN